MLANRIVVSRSRSRAPCCLISTSKASNNKYQYQVKLDKAALVAGGTGFIGRKIFDELLKRQTETYILSRQGGFGKYQTWKGLEKKGLPWNVDTIINATGHNVMDVGYRWGAEFEKLIYDSRVGTARKLSQLIRESSSRKPKVMIQITGVGYYPPTEEDILYDEESQVNEFDFMGKLVKDWEEAARESGIRTVLIRSGAVLGGSGGIIRRIFLPFYLGLGGPLGTGNQYLPWIHINDLVGIVMHAIENENVHGVLNAVAPQIITYNDFVKVFAASLNRSPRIPTPEFLVKLIFDGERTKMLLQGQRVVPKRTIETGYNFIHPDIESACKNLIRVPKSSVFPFLN